MMNKNNNIWTAKSDASIAATIGAFIKHHRLEQNKTQSLLAQEAGIDRTTLVKFEKGQPSNLMTFIQILRALNMLHMLEQFKVTPQLSPLQLAEMELTKRKRARSGKEKTQRKKTDW